MDENEAVDKMRGLKKSIKTALRYERSGEKLPEVVLIILIAILAAGFVAFSVNLYNLETLNPFLGNILIGNSYFGVGIPVLLLYAIFAFVVHRILHRPFTVSPENSWNEYLKEGVIGIMRIIEISDWEGILINLKKAKQAFIVLSAMSFLLNLGIIFHNPVLCIRYSDHRNFRDTHQSVFGTSWICAYGVWCWRQDNQKEL